MGTNFTTGCHENEILILSCINLAFTLVSLTVWISLTFCMYLKYTRPRQKKCTLNGTVVKVEDLVGHSKDEVEYDEVINPSYSGVNVYPSLSDEYGRG